MRWFCLLSFAALLVPPSLYAQSSNGYVVGGISSRDEKLASQVAVGAEWDFYKGVGISGEIGAIMGHDSFAVFSFNGYYSPPASDSSAVRPFVSGGYTVGVDLLPFNMFNAGVGLNYWFLRRLALRTAVRAYVLPGGNATNTFWGFRLGFAFR